MWHGLLAHVSHVLLLRATRAGRKLVRILLHTATAKDIGGIDRGLVPVKRTKLFRFMDPLQFSQVVLFSQADVWT